MIYPVKKTVKELFDRAFKERPEEGCYCQAKIIGSPPTFLPIRIAGGTAGFELSEEPLDLSPYFLEKKEKVLYQLIGFTRHTPGHWTSIVKLDGQWHLVDDAKVSKLTWDEVKLQYANNAWELFYERS